MPNVKSSTPKPASSPTSTRATRRSGGAPMRKQPKSKPEVYWINLYWDQFHVGLMCVPEEHGSRQEADNEYNIHRLMFGENVWRIGFQAHKVTHLENERTVDIPLREWMKEEPKDASL